MKLAVQISVRVPFLKILLGGLAGSYGNSVFKFLRNHCTVSHSGCAI